MLPELGTVHALSDDLVQQIQPETVYWYAKVSEGCIGED